MNLTTLNITALIPTRIGCSIFLNDPDGKTIQFFIEHNIGQAINDHLAGNLPPRPATFNMFTSLTEALGASLRRFTITHHETTGDEDGIYYAKMVWEMSNELGHQKIIEVDCRPSDGIALAVRQDVPIHISTALWDSLPDKSQMLAEIREQMGDS